MRHRYRVHITNEQCFSALNPKVWVRMSKLCDGGSGLFKQPLRIVVYLIWHTIKP